MLQSLQNSGTHPMGNPSSGSKVQTTMSLSKGRHRQSLSVGASLQLEKLAQLEKLSSAENLSSSALSPRITEDQSIAAFLGDKKMKRRTRSSLGGSEDFTKELELNGVALGAEGRKPLSSVSLRGHRRVGSGNVTPIAAESPRAKGMCTPPGVEKYAVAKIAASLLNSPRKLERSMSLSRVAHKVISDADGTPRSRTRVGEVILPNKQNTLAEAKLQDSQRELESRLQAVVAHRSENGSSRNSCSKLLEKKAGNDNANGEQSDTWPFSCIGSDTQMSTVKGTVPCAHGNDENSHREITAVPTISVENSSHGLLVSTVDSIWPNDEHLCSNAACLPVKDIHPVCFETTNMLRTEQAATMSLDMGHDPHGIAKRCSLSNVTSTQQPHSSRGSYCNGPEAAFEPLHSELQSGNLSNIHLENSHRINHPDVLSTSTSFPDGLDLSYQDIKEVTLPQTFEASQTKILVCNQENEAEKNAHSIAHSSDKVTSAELTEAEFLPSLICKNDPAGPVLIREESKQVVTDASQGRDVEEIHFSQEKEVDLRKINGPDACLRKSTSFELGEKRTILRKRRRSVSASGIGAMLLKVVRVSESGSLETRSLPKLEPEVSDAILLQSMGLFQPPTTSLHQDALHETETNNIDVVDMDVEYEDCSSELVAPDREACYDVNVEDPSDNKDTKRLSEEAKLQLVDDTQLCKIKNYTEGGQSELALHGSQEGSDQIAGSGSRSSNDECEKREISSETIVNCNCHFTNKSGSGITTDELHEEPLLEERFLDARDKSLDRDLFQRETSSTSEEGLNGACHGEKIINQDVVTENARVNGHIVNIEEGPGGNRRRRQGSRGRISHDLDSSTVTIEESRRSLSLVDENVCMMTNLERSRSFASMLQVSPRQSVDESRLAPSSIAILTNPSFSSSHQDRLWEEQAEYSSGGRGTPGREDDAAVDVLLHSPSPGGAISSDDQIHSAAASLRKGQDRDMSAGSCSSFASTNGRSHEKKKVSHGKKKGRPQRSPLRSLLAAEDLHNKPPANHRSPERGHFLQQILSRIRGRSSSKSSSPKSSDTTPKRRISTIWTSCICFSYVK